MKANSIQDIKKYLSDRGWCCCSDAENPFTLVVGRERGKGDLCIFCASSEGTAIAFEGYKRKQGNNHLRHVCADMVACKQREDAANERELKQRQRMKDRVLEAVKLPI